MFTLLILLAAGATPQSEQALLRSCDMTAEGWVCHYRIPAVTAVPVTDTNAAAPPPTVPRSLVAPSLPEVIRTSPDSAAAERLMLRCAEASWLSLCTPGDRRQARILKDAATARAALRLDVSRLLSEQNCDEAVRVALIGGDMTLAREARGFCQVADTARVSSD